MSRDSSNATTGGTERRRRRPSRRDVPIMVLPGLAGSDASTVAIRSHLALRGHPVRGWGLGRNEGPSPQLFDELTARLERVAEQSGGPVGLVGWSLGGAYSVWLAINRPSLVRLVVTMGSPLARVGTDGVPSDIPLTSIWSRQDRVVPWHRSVVGPGERREDVEVRSLHLTLGFDPTVLAVVDDRAGEPIDGWRPFRPPPWARVAYPTRSGD